MARVTPIALAYNTAYLIESEGEGERLLVDTGPDYLGARELLTEALEGPVPPVIVASHGHLDHAGLGRWWQTRGASVALGRNDAHLVRRPHFAIPGEFEAFAEYVRASGAPAEVQREVMAGLERRRRWVEQATGEGPHPPPRPGDRWPTGLRFEPFEPDRLLEDGELLPGGAKVVHCPGHTPGNLVVIVEEEGLLFSGDQVLPDITPTPGVQFVRDAAGTWRRFPSLPPFLWSLLRLQAFQFDRCYPGHGEPFDDVAEVLTASVDQIEQRTRRVCAELALAETTLHGLSERLYPRALDRRWWQIVATVQGHLDLLETRAEATKNGDTWRAT